MNFPNITRNWRTLGRAATVVAATAGSVLSPVALIGSVNKLLFIASDDSFAKKLGAAVFFSVATGGAAMLVGASFWAVAGLTALGFALPDGGQRTKQEARDAGDAAFTNLFG